MCMTLVSNSVCSLLLYEMNRFACFACLYIVATPFLNLQSPPHPLVWLIANSEASWRNFDSALAGRGSSGNGTREL